jgi:hypothetical protein
MATGPSSQAIEPSAKEAGRLHAPSPRLVAVVVGWFFGWPVVFFACLPLVTPGNEPEAWLLGAGSLLWFLSCYGMCGLLFAMAEARWPAAARIRKILGFVFDIMRIFQGHHSS